MKMLRWISIEVALIVDKISENRLSWLGYVSKRNET